MLDPDLVYTRGSLAKAFVAGDFWKNYLEPKLKEAKAQIALESMSIPAYKQDVDQIAILMSLNAGKIEGIESVMTGLQSWINQYERAEFDLQEKEKKETQ